MVREIVPNADPATHWHGAPAELGTAQGWLVVKWETAEQIAARWVGVQPYRISAVAIFVGVHNMAHHVRDGDGCTEYSPAAVGLIERECLGRSYKRTDTVGWRNRTSPRRDGRNELDDNIDARARSIGWGPGQDDLDVEDS